MPKVSVIIPVYNAGKYIKKCAESLFSQTLKDIEFIFVDDCTPDDSIDIVKETLLVYPERAEQVKIVRADVNGGSVKARRLGLGNVTGDFIIFCDSDDWLDRNAFSLMYERAIRDSLDIVVGSYYCVTSTGEKFYPAPSDFRNDCLSDLLSYRISGSLCIKLVKANIWKQKIIDPLYSMTEDSVFSIQLFLYATRIGFEPKAIYYYYFNPEGICQSQETGKILDRYEGACANAKMIIDFLKERGIYERYEKEMVVLKARHRNYLLPLIQDKKYYRMWHNTFIEINKDILFNRYVSTELKVKYILAIMGVFPMARRIVRRIQKK